MSRSGPENGPPRLADVARLAGVSAMTASNVVRGVPGVRQTTRERVLRAVESLGYQPNLPARTLRSGRSGIIALAVPAVHTPYFAELARHVMDEAATLGWTVLIDQTTGSRERELQVAAGIHPALIDGVIFFPQAIGAGDLGRSGRTPMVLLGDRGNQSAGGRGLDVVTIDNVAAAATATDHLLASARRRVAVIGGDPDQSEVSARRLAGYHRALTEAGVAYRLELIARVDSFTRAEGAAAMARLLDQDEPPDAVFCFSDLLAIGAMYTARDRGLKIPRDLAVAGFDDIEEAAYAHPPLTTIGPSKQRIAELAVGLLADRLEAGTTTPPVRQERADFDLVVRGSTQPGRAQPSRPPAAR